MRPKHSRSLFLSAAVAALLITIQVVAQSTPTRSLLALSKRNHMARNMGKSDCESCSLRSLKRARKTFVDSF